MSANRAKRIHEVAQSVGGRVTSVDLLTPTDLVVLDRLANGAWDNKAIYTSDLYAQLLAAITAAASGSQDLLNTKEFWLLAGPGTVAQAGFDPDNSLTSQNQVASTSAGLLCSHTFRTADFDTDQAYWSSTINSGIYFNFRAKLYGGLRLDDGASNSRCWFGWAGTPVGIKGTDAPAVAVVAFRASVGAADTTWKAIVGDGVNQTVVDTTVAISTTVTQHFRIEWGLGATSILFYINDVLVATISTNLPAPTTNLRFILSVECVSGGVRRFITFSQIRGQYSNV